MGRENNLNSWFSRKSQFVFLTKITICVSLYIGREENKEELQLKLKNREENVEFLT